MGGNLQKREGSAKTSKISKIIFLFSAATLLYSIYIEFLCRKFQFDPKPLQYPPLPTFNGTFALNNLLSAAKPLNQIPIRSPECVAVHSGGFLVVGSESEGIARIDLNGSVSQYAYYGKASRPLGIRFDDEDNLYVADAHLGLLKIDAKTKLATILTTRADDDGTPIQFANFLDISSKTGKIYFTDSTKFAPQLRSPQGGGYGTLESSMMEFLSGSRSGRLLMYDPLSGKTTTLASDLYFPNGVALSQDESFLLVAETFERRLLKYWLQGPRKGSFQVFIDQLPMYPDNLSRGPSGDFYIGLPYAGNRLMESFGPFPFLRKLLAFIPRFLKPDIGRHCAFVRMDPQGNVKNVFHQTSENGIHSLTHAVEYKNKIYLGTLEGNFLFVMNQNA
eukprot:Sdes_comp20911_c0_seq1m18175